MLAPSGTLYTKFPKSVHVHSDNGSLDPEMRGGARSQDIPRDEYQLASLAIPSRGVVLEVYDSIARSVILEVGE